MDKFIAKRISLENVGFSELDDVIVKKLLREYASRIEALTKDKTFEALLFNQGFVACLDFVIQTMRQQQRQNIINEEDDQ